MAGICHLLALRNLICDGLGCRVDKIEQRLKNQRMSDEASEELKAPDKKKSGTVAFEAINFAMYIGAVLLAVYMFYYYSKSDRTPYVGAMRGVGLILIFGIAGASKQIYFWLKNRDYTNKHRQNVLLEFAFVLALVLVAGPLLFLVAFAP